MSDSLNALHEAHHAAHGAAPDGGTGVVLPMHYGDFEGEVAAIEGGLGVFAVWEKAAAGEKAAAEVLMIRGPAAVEFLNGLTSNDVKALATGKAHYNLICANKGKILHEIVVVRAGEEQLLVIPQPGEGEAVARYLEHYHIREELELGMVELARIELLGPGIASGLEAAGLSASATRAEFGGGAVLLPRLPLGRLARVVALLPPPNAPALVEALLGAPGAKLVGFEAFDEARVWAGMPRAGADYGPDHLPAEAALYDHVSFNKGCYMGQEIHARMHHRGHPNRKLTGVTLPAGGGSASEGSELFLEERAIGPLTSLARLPRGGKRRGIAMLRYKEIREHPALGLTPGGPAEVDLWPLASDLGAGKG